MKHSGLISGESDFYGSVSSEQFLPGQRQKQVLIIPINDDIPEVCIYIVNKVTGNPYHWHFVPRNKDVLFQFLY